MSECAGERKFVSAVWTSVCSPSRVQQTFNKKVMLHTLWCFCYLYSHSHWVWSLFIVPHYNLISPKQHSVFKRNFESHKHRTQKRKYIHINIQVWQTVYSLPSSVEKKTWGGYFGWILLNCNKACQTLCMNELVAWNSGAVATFWCILMTYGVTPWINTSTTAEGGVPAL
jgi:hypothetical protein